MIQVNMPAAFRSVFGKGASRQLRMKDKTPAVLYSGGADAVALQCDAIEMFKKLYAIHGRNAVVTLEIDGDEKPQRHVLVQEIQKNPVTDSLVHIDFLEIDLEKPAVFTVPLQYTGTPKGVDLGGELQKVATAIKLKGCPLDIPDYVEVDIKGLGRGESLTFDDIALPEKVEMLSKRAKPFVLVV
ncbi:MAG: 50S ribosomal protein L25 [Desulfobulbaceae bacterium]|nr:50S ribosomal protein L25 [Desulfobulbaceae bacterium]